MRSTLILTIIVTTTVLSEYSVNAQAVSVDTSCIPTEDCTPTFDCLSFLTPPQRQDCTKCLLHSPLGGGCTLTGNDPVCEAQNAANRVTYETNKSAQRAQCETQKTVQKATCEARKEAAKLACEASKVSEKGLIGSTLSLVKLPAGDPLPESIVVRLQAVYDKKSLDKLTVTKIDRSA